MNRYALLFPGQGAHFIGMGRSFAENDPDSFQIYQKASKNLNLDLVKICFEENDLLTKTEYAQKAIFVTSAAIYEAFQKTVDELPSALVGFSLGEYSALYASGAVCFENMLRLIDARSKWMEEDSLKHPGAMAALLGGDRDKIRDFCQKTTESIGFLAIANLNSPVQVVVTGSVEGIAHLEENYKDLGVKRFVRLNVGGAFHSPFMNESARRMKELFKGIQHHSPRIPIVANATARYLNSSDLASNIERQIVSPVRFEESIRFLIAEGIRTFIEIGPGTVLTGLVKKIDPDVETISINEFADLAKLEEQR